MPASRTPARLFAILCAALVAACAASASSTPSGSTGPSGSLVPTGSAGPSGSSTPSGSTGALILLCPCHGAPFDAAHDGAVIAGPTSTPLAKLPIRVDTASGSIFLAG
jgi:Rieske Fe-S protein